LDILFICLERGTYACSMQTCIHFSVIVFFGFKCQDSDFVVSYRIEFLLIRVEKYIQTLTSKTKPKKILVCMIYYPDETNTASWAGGALRVLGYNSEPGKLQTLIKKTFEEATRLVVLCVLTFSFFAIYISSAGMLSEYLG